MSVAIYSYSQHNYLNYHKDILKAEQLFFTRQFDSSLKKYEQAFNTYPKQFAKDCYVALQFAAMNKDTIRAKLFLKYAVENGATWDVLYKAKHVNNLLRDFKFKRFADDIYASARKKYVSSINWFLRDSVNRLIENDNTTKAIANKDFLSGKTFRDSNKVFHTYSDHPYNRTLDSNVLVLVALVKKYGYPGQHVVGLKDQELDKKTEKRDHNFESIANLIFYHHYCAFHYLKRELLKAIEDGEILPNEYALMYEWGYNEYFQKQGQLRGSNNYNHFNLICEYPVQDKFYNHFLSPWYYSKDTILVNKCRAEISMQSITHEVIKRRCGQNNDIIFGNNMFNFP